MSQQKLNVASIISVMVIVLAVIASVGGLARPDLYRDNPAVVAGWFTNDLLTLLIAVPLLAGSMLVTRRGSMRAFLVWMGLLDYMLYNFAFYVFGAVLNELYFVYLGVFMLAALGLIFGLANADIRAVRPTLGHTAARWISGYMVLWAVGLGTLWVFQWLNVLNGGPLPPFGEPGVRLTAALDWSLVVCPFILGAVWLWQGRRWGYALALITNVKGAVYALVLIGGSLMQARAGVAGALELVPLWVVAGIACLGVCIVLLRQKPLIEHSSVERDQVMLDRPARQQA